MNKIIKWEKYIHSLSNYGPPHCQYFPQLSIVSIFPLKLLKQYQYLSITKIPFIILFYFFFKKKKIKNEGYNFFFRFFFYFLKQLILLIVFKFF
jgi:hypothetical protein